MAHDAPEAQECQRPQEALIEIAHPEFRLLPDRLPERIISHKRRVAVRTRDRAWVVLGGLAEAFSERALRIWTIRHAISSNQLDGVLPMSQGKQEERPGQEQLSNSTN